MTVRLYGHHPGDRIRCRPAGPRGPVRRRAARLAAFLSVILISMPPTRAAAPQRGLTGAARIAPAYDAILDGRFGDLPTVLRHACQRGPAAAVDLAPAEACDVIEVVGLWWQIQLDPWSTERDARFQSRVDAVIAATDAWTVREPDRAEAWFYRGAAYGARVQWRVLRSEQLAAARDGKRIKDALERALALDPQLHDAWFGIGLYHYYADVAPTAAKMLRWLLFLPGGNRVQGMQEMLRARDSGALMRGEADYQLHVLYLWYEKQPQRALELLRGLQTRHPSNPHFLQLIAEVQDTYLHDFTGSLRSWQTLIEEARGGRLTNAPMALTRARLGAALQLDRLFESDVAVEHLRAVIQSTPTAPYGAAAEAQLQLGRALDRLGDRAGATAAYRAAIATAPPGDPLKVGAAARAGLRDAPRPTPAEAYRLSIEGWRALQRGQLAEASRALDRSLALQPQDAVTQYRRARLLLARRDAPGALSLLETIARTRATTPPTIYALACADAAHLHEQRGERTRAIELYRTAQDVFGADERTKDDARRAIARLTKEEEGRR